MILGRQLIESYEENEKLFSTGNDELDDLLEEVYYSGISDGYDYAQKEFAEKKEKSKLDLQDRLDRKLIRKINKKFKVNSDEIIRDYENVLKNPNLSEKDRKSIEGLIDQEKLADGKISEDEYIEKHPRAKRGSRVLERSLAGASLASGATGLGFGMAALSKLRKDPAKAKKIAKRGAIPALASVGLMTAAVATNNYRDKKAEKKNKK